MRYSELEKMYIEIKNKEKEGNEVNYIPRLQILDEYKQYGKDFDSLDEETKRKLIEATYFYWVESTYPIESSQVMAEIVMTEKDSSFVLKLRNGAITVKEIAALIAKNEEKLSNAMYC